MERTNREKHNSGGFTLIELLLVVALMAISVGVTGDILVSLVRSYNKSRVTNEIEQNANFVAQKLTKELRNAEVVTDLDPSTAPPGVGDTYNGITFSTREDPSRSINYTVSDGKITRSVDGGAAVDLTDDDSKLGISVTCPGSADCFQLINGNPQVIKISIAFQQQSGETEFTSDITIEDTIVIRNTY